jgi:hypothetical protein
MIRTFGIARSGALSRQMLLAGCHWQARVSFRIWFHLTATVDHMQSISHRRSRLFPRRPHPDIEHLFRQYEQRHGQNPSSDDTGVDRLGDETK